MKTRLILSALFKFRNISVFLIMLCALYILISVLQGMLGSGLYAAAGTAVPVVSAVVYLVLVIQSLMSKKFHEEFNHSQKIRLLQDLNFTCLKLSNEAKKHTNTVYYQKLRRVMEDKNEIVDSFFKGENGYLKGRIVEQTLNLVISYTKLLINFCKRSRELSELDVSEIAGRLNANTRKLAFTRNPDITDELKKVIEMDEKFLNRLKDEKVELERISTKLDYMESMVNMFKHQILSSVESEEMVEQLETAVNEATALDNVLEERRKNKKNTVSGW